MEAVAGIERQRGLAAPGLQPGVRHREIDAADVRRGGRVRFGDFLERGRPRGRRPDREERRARPGLANPLVESGGPFAQVHAALRQAGRALLQHHHAPTAAIDLAQRGSFGPVVLERKSRKGHDRGGKAATGCGRERGDDAGQVVRHRPRPVRRAPHPAWWSRPRRRRGSRPPGGVRRGAGASHDGTADRRHIVTAVRAARGGARGGASPGASPARSPGWWPRRGWRTSRTSASPGSGTRAATRIR